MWSPPAPPRTKLGYILDRNGEGEVQGQGSAPTAPTMPSQQKSGQQKQQIAAEGWSVSDISTKPQAAAESNMKKSPPVDEHDADEDDLSGDDTSKDGSVDDTVDEPGPGPALRISFDDISLSNYRIIFKISYQYRYRIYFENITRY